jgi:ArsR family transcriptional regulator
VSAYYRFDEAQLDPAQRALWHALSNGSDDPLLRQDAERVAAVLAHRASDQNWADSVAGDMERHYSPGRTWERLRAPLPLLETGDVLDIASGDGVLAELVAPHAKRYICIDTSARVVAAASERLRRLPNVEVREGDMHALPFKDGSFDLVVLMHALTYASKPAQAVTEAARVLRPGGRLLLCSLARTNTRRGGSLRPRQPRLQRQGAAQVRRQGRPAGVQPGDGHPRKASATSK